MVSKKAAVRDWHPEDVKAAIRKKGVSLSELARRHRLSNSAIKMTLRRRSAPVQSIIAAHLGLPPWEIWPSRYDERHEPIDGRRCDGARSGRGSTLTQRQIRGGK